jgi:hypothetical protein
MTLLPLWVVIFVALGIPVLVATRWLVITIARRRKINFVNSLKMGEMWPTAKSSQASRVKGIEDILAAASRLQPAHPNSG